MRDLRDDPATYSYQDITNMVRQLKCESIYGYYIDGWMDEKAKIRVMAGSTGRIDLELLYPGTVAGRKRRRSILTRIYFTLRWRPTRTVLWSWILRTISTWKGRWSSGAKTVFPLL